MGLPWALRDVDNPDPDFMFGFLEEAFPQASVGNVGKKVGFWNLVIEPVNRFRPG